MGLQRAQPLAATLVEAEGEVEELSARFAALLGPGAGLSARRLMLLGCRLSRKADRGAPVDDEPVAMTSGAVDGAGTRLRAARPRGIG